MCQDTDTGKEWRFVASRWLQGSTLMVELVPEGEHTEVSCMLLALSLTLSQYSVTVVTGDKQGAGTDAAVYLLLKGTDGVSPEIELARSKTAMNKFERGQVR